MGSDYRIIDLAKAAIVPYGVCNVKRKIRDEERLYWDVMYNVEHDCHMIIVGWELLSFPMDYIWRICSIIPQNILLGSNEEAKKYLFDFREMVDGEFEKSKAFDWSTYAEPIRESTEAVCSEGPAASAGDADDGASDQQKPAPA